MNTFWDVFWERREELLKLFVEHMEMTSTAVLVSDCWCDNRYCNHKKQDGGFHCDWHSQT